MAKEKKQFNVFKVLLGAGLVAAGIIYGNVLTTVLGTIIATIGSVIIVKELEHLGWL